MHSKWHDKTDAYFWAYKFMLLGLTDCIENNLITYFIKCPLNSILVLIFFLLLNTKSTLNSIFYFKITNN